MMNRWTDQSACPTPILQFCKCGIDGYLSSGIDCPKLQPADVKLKNYSQDEIPILGKYKVQVQCQGKSANLFVVVSKGNRQNILGRTWIDSLKLDLNKIYHMTTVGTTNPTHSTFDASLNCYSNHRR